MEFSRLPVSLIHIISRQFIIAILLNSKIILALYLVVTAFGIDILLLPDESDLAMCSPIRSSSPKTLQ